MLEDVLVANPDILMSELTLVGRQIPVETGFVDLVGIDEDGPCRTQKSEPSWPTAPATHGIERIGDFDEWYGS